ncbi:MAG: sn-glycerol-3-phosphate ABC transporter permease UgpE [Neisseriaceae bacterium]|nr:sn-glycerol-3-phosphate ABC transporter permease UgpE [Neisseriaceae bacterium]
MVENRPWLRGLSHGVLWLGVALIAFPLYLTFVASTQSASDIVQAPMSLWPGPHLLENYRSVLLGEGHRPAVGQMLWVSLVMALLIAVGKISVSFLAAFAMVYCQFPCRKLVFGLIFMTLMLPVEVRISPTFDVVVGLGLANTYAGLTLPLMASATATFLFRQFFMTVPNELVEAAKIDGAGPLRFLKDVLWPLSQTSIAALFVIQFTYGWNQYLWPLVLKTTEDMTTVVVGIRAMMGADSAVEWHLVMATAMLAMVPPCLVVVLMQKWFVKGLVDSEK